MRSLALLALCGCGFSGGSNPGDRDAGTDAPPVEACDPLELRYSINEGAEVVNADPPAMVVRLGDSIEIDGTLACGREGAPSFAWQVPPAFAGDTGSPTSRLITVAPIEVGTHVIDLEISDSAESMTMQLSVEVRGVQYLEYIDSANDGCNGLTLTTGELWVACNNGVYLVDLDDPHAPGIGGVYPTPNNAPGRATRVMAESDDFVWFTDSTQNNRTFRYDVAGENLDELLNGDTGVTGSIRRLAPFPGGVRVLTTTALWNTGDGGGSFNRESDVDPQTVTESATGDVWTGDEELVHVSQADATVDVFAGPDDGLRAMVFDGDELWVGGDLGAARLVDGAVTERFTTLLDLRDLVVDPITGDIWAASDGEGLYRYSRRLDQWLRFSGSQVGLNSDNLRAIVIDTSGGRDAVYLGTNNGLHVLTTSFAAP